MVSYRYDVIPNTIIYPYRHRAPHLGLRLRERVALPLRVLVPDRVRDGLRDCEGAA
jgi:hypothetical protein